jgi:hypothetical protein
VDTVLPFNQVDGAVREPYHLQLVDVGSDFSDVV